MRVSTPATPCLFPLGLLLKLVTFFLSKNVLPFICHVSYLLSYRLSLTACLPSLLLYCLRLHGYLVHYPFFLSIHDYHKVVHLGRSAFPTDEVCPGYDRVGRCSTEPTHITVHASTGNHAVFRIVISSRESYISVVSTPAHRSCGLTERDALDPTSMTRSGGSTKIKDSLPTGVGKTVVFVSLLEWLQAFAGNTQATPSLVIVNSVGLARQAADQARNPPSTGR